MCKCTKEKLIERFLIPVLILCAILTVIIIIIQFVVGILYRDQCPIQPLVPIYNLVAGSTGIAIILLSLFLLVTVFWLERCSSRIITVPLVILLILLVLFQIAWGMVGGYYTLPLRKNNSTQFENSQLNTYCQPVLFWISFVILIIYFSALSLAGVDAFGMLPSSS